VGEERLFSPSSCLHDMPTIHISWNSFHTGPLLHRRENTTPVTNREYKVYQAMQHPKKQLGSSRWGESFVPGP
jgi:hypothetical protein